MNERHLELSDYYRIFYSGRWYIALALLLTLSFTIYLNTKLEPVYRTTATIMIKSNAPEGNIFLNQEFELPAKMEDQLQLLRSRNLARKVIDAASYSQWADNLEILHSPTRARTVGESISILQRTLYLEPVKNSNFIHISIEAGTPFEAQYLTNTVTEEFYQQNQDFSKGRFNELKVFLQEQIVIVSSKLQSAEEQLRLFKEEHRVAVLDTETAILVQSLATLTSQLNAIRIDIRANEEALRSLREQYLQGKSTMVEDVIQTSTPIIEELLTQIGRKQTRIANLQSKLDEPGSQEMVRKLELEIKQIRETLTVETRQLAESGLGIGDPIKNMQELFDEIIDLEVSNKTLHAREEALVQVTARYETKLEELPETSLLLARLERDRELNEKIYSMLMERYEETQILAAGKMGSVHIVDRAINPGSPIKPNKRLNIILAIVVGLLLGVGFSFLLFLLDSRVRTIEDVARLDIKLLGTVPFIDSQKIERRLREVKDQLEPIEEKRISARLITHFAPKSPISEAYRSLRTNIMFSNEEHPPKVMLFTSSAVQEGKTLTGANLGVVFAQTGERMLIIDCDMRRPTMHRVFNLRRTPGLSNLLAGDCTLEQAIVPTDIGNLSVLPAGEIPANPSELLASQRMRDLLTELRDNYDYILLDTPPVVAVTDAAVLSRLVDAVGIVVASGKVHRREVRTALQQMQNVRAKLMGVVLNSLNMRQLYGPYYYYYHYYNYYYYYGTDQVRHKQRRKQNRRRRKEAV
ncbi:MAG: polysaccharide biosynthesis tyrosine autokinase [Candidatus Delongbacteria bacterium]|nr:polysaccharide biosynthesis tyrosine autokinase [Candidatus Delongbacteria bacterium]